MKLWIDAQISPHLAPWIEKEFGIKSYSIWYLNFQNEEDKIIYEKARNDNAIVMTKDDDFVQLQYQFGPPPKIIWLTCGNTSNIFLKNLLKRRLESAILLLEKDNILVEIRS